MSSNQRRYLSTIGVFGAASLIILAFLAFRPSDRISYELPVLTPFDRGDVTAISIARPIGTITLRQEAGRWLVAPGDFLADATNVDFLLSTVTEFTITDVVSVSDDPGRYDLDEADRVRVTVEGEGGTLRVFDIGRRAATFGHTFVRIPGDVRILQAGGTLRSLFARAVDDFRDKSVLTFDPATITEITVTRELPDEPLQTVHLVRSATGWERDDEPGEGAPSTLDPAGIEAALRFLGDLPAYRYRYTDDPIGDPWLTVTLEGDETYTLSLYPELANIYPARSSGSDFTFDMFLFQAGLVSEPFGLE